MSGNIYKIIEHVSHDENKMVLGSTENPLQALVYQSNSDANTWPPNTRKRNIQEVSEAGQD